MSSRYIVCFRKCGKIIQRNNDVFEVWFRGWLIICVPTLMMQPKWFRSDKDPKMGGIQAQNNLRNSYKNSVLVVRGDTQIDFPTENVAPTFLTDPSTPPLIPLPKHHIISIYRLTTYHLPLTTYHLNTHTHVRTHGVISPSRSHFPLKESFPRQGVISPSRSHFPLKESFPRQGVISPSRSHFPVYGKKTCCGAATRD